MSLRQAVPKSTAQSCRCYKKLNKDDVIVERNEIGSKTSSWKIPVQNGDFTTLPEKAKQWIVEKAELMRPQNVHLCDGSKQEGDELTRKLVTDGVLTELKKYENCYICRTDPKDVARVESKTFIVTPNKFDAVAHTASGVAPVIGQWMEPDTFATEIDNRFPNCMSGRTMYVIPYSMGSIGGALSKIGIQLTDSGYVVMCMRIMTRVSSTVWKILGEQDFVPGVHSVGVPLPLKSKLTNSWPCNPEKTLIGHRPAEREIWSFGSGYGGNSLLAKKCFALRIACVIGRDESWLAEHMLIMNVTSPQGKQRCFVAAFPSACGKTNLAMLQPTLPGWRVQCAGDDIAWIRFNKDGRMVAINPENGFFGVASGTSNKTNPVAMQTVVKNTIFTNVASTADGGFFWEGLEDEVDKNVEITTWLNEKWKVGQPGKAAHPNSRFASPVVQCPIIHPRWEDADGLPIDAIIFGGRRPEGVPLVYETFNWTHGVMAGAFMKSEATSAAEFTGKSIMHDPMGMRPFLGYNFGKYLQHWLSFERPPNKMPKIYHVNWFRKSDNGKGKFLWPGFGENIRVLDWICRRLDGEDVGEASPIGVLPKKGSINLESMKEPVDWDELFSMPKAYWAEDAKEVRTFVEQQIGQDFPEKLRAEMKAQEERINNM